MAILGYILVGLFAALFIVFIVYVFRQEPRVEQSAPSSFLRRTEQFAAIYDMTGDEIEKFIDETARPLHFALEKLNTNTSQDEITEEACREISELVKTRRKELTRVFPAAVLNSLRDALHESSFVRDPQAQSVVLVFSEYFREAFTILSTRDKELNY